MNKLKEDLHAIVYIDNAYTNGGEYVLLYDVSPLIDQTEIYARLHTKQYAKPATGADHATIKQIFQNEIPEPDAMDFIFVNASEITYCNTKPLIQEVLTPKSITIAIVEPLTDVSIDLYKSKLEKELQSLKFKESIEADKEVNIKLIPLTYKYKLPTVIIQDSGMTITNESVTYELSIKVDLIDVHNTLLYSTITDQITKYIKNKLYDND